MALLLGGLAVYGFSGRIPTATPQPTESTPRRQLTPTLYCDFYNFMRNSTVVSFYFSVDRAETAAPKVSELFVVDSEGSKTAFGEDGQAPQPVWDYSLEEGTPTITSPDAQNKIVLYGLKPKQDGVFWVEAGIRSNDYRNLEGKCRQANFGDPTASSRTTP